MKLNEFNRKLKKEYNDTFKEIKVKRSFHFGFKQLVLSMLSLVVILLVVDHINISIHNYKVDKIKEEIMNKTELEKVNTYDDYLKIRNKTNIVKETSLLSEILNFKIACASANPNGSAPGDVGNQTNTNVQFEGIDEADVAKCDGEYIYSLNSTQLIIYNLDGDIVSSIDDDSFELYVDNYVVVTIGEIITNVYLFEEESLILNNSITYSKYNDSRLKDHHLYLVSSNMINESNIAYGNCYSDLFVNPYFVYTITDIDLNDFSVKEVQTLSGYNTIIYMSNNHFYFSVSNRFNNIYITSIVIYDIELNPVGLIRVDGTILNQFSMDEYNGYFRVVSTDISKNAGYINAVSIYDLDTLEKLGYLNEDIGIGRQIIKSVRFEGDVCYCVTYENRDPLYEINVSDPYNPIIVSKYESPGYSNYLHNFSINDTEYVLGLGFTDSLVNTKISVYLSENGTEQIGKDYIIGNDLYSDKCDYYNENHNVDMFSNHKALFIYSDGVCLYLGVNLSNKNYTIFKIDVSAGDVVSIFKEFETDFNSRCFLIDGKLLITCEEELIISNW